MKLVCYLDPRISLLFIQTNLEQLFHCLDSQVIYLFATGLMYYFTIKQQFEVFYCHDHFSDLQCFYNTDDGELWLVPHRDQESQVVQDSHAKEN